MKIFLITICTILVIVIVGVLLTYRPDTTPMPTATTTPTTISSTNLSLTSSAFADGALIPAVYSCEGKNVNPPLSISGIPSVATTLALTLEDPDAPMGTFDHWVVYNIDPTTRKIGQATEPVGSYGKNGSGKTGYLGPCPPSGTHHYIFTLYALDMKIPGDGFTKEDLQDAMKGHIVAQAKLTGTYTKSSK